MEKGKILTIDDSPDMLFLEKTVLEREGFEVFTADTAKAALEMIPKIPDLSLILCDVEMDNMDGLQFVERLEADHNRVFHDTPVVLVTALEAHPKAHVAGYIRKATDIDVFAAQVKSFMSSSNPSPMICPP